MRVAVLLVLLVSGTPALAHHETVAISMTPALLAGAAAMLAVWRAWRARK